MTSILEYGNNEAAVNSANAFAQVGSRMYTHKSDIEPEFWYGRGDRRILLPSSVRTYGLALPVVEGKGSEE
uniref:Uncharacterized protein n=1 Tax=Echinococcus granulosus TaxID=6210 RepID=A0A068WYN4_ECHGR|nr:hypothetical protein EgrG_000087200 [Echinococcus granulosus]